MHLFGHDSMMQRPALTHSTRRKLRDQNVTIARAFPIASELFVTAGCRCFPSGNILYRRAGETKIEPRDCGDAEKVREKKSCGNV